MSTSARGWALSSDGSCGFTALSDLQNADPKLGPLADNGGPTETQALLSGSPAIDAADSAACPGACLADCTCSTAAAAVVEADTTVSSAQPTAILGGEPVLSVDAGPSVKRTFFRIRVSGVGSRRVASARLQLQVANLLNAESVLGGTIHAITACGWDEHVLTWNSQPSIDGPVLAGTGPVTQGQRVEFDVTPAITADGVYCFALDSSSEDAAHYNSREAGAGRPAMAVLVQ